MSNITVDADVGDFQAAVARVSALLAARKKKETIKAQPVREKKVRGSKKGKAPKGLD